MFEVKKEISFSYQGKIDKFLVGSKISQQELIEKLNQDNFEFFCKKEFLKELPKEIQEIELQEEIQETQYRFETSGYKQADGSAFRKNSIYTETEIKEAGLVIEELMEKEVITWLK